MYDVQLLIAFVAVAVLGGGVIGWILRDLEGDWYGRPEPTEHGSDPL